MSKKTKKTAPKILIFDIETSPVVAHVWGLWDQNVGINQIKEDWHILSWSAKWLDSTKIMYQDQRKAKNMEDDKKLLQGIWKLLDEADIVITQNGKSFDVKKLNARFIIHGFQPPSPFKHIDTLILAKRHFKFTSNKLEYLSKTLNKKYTKLSVRKFAGFELWRECLKGNQSAWNEMEKYNKLDVLSLEEVYKRMIPWDSTINFSIYDESDVHTCTCGSTHTQKRGFDYTASGKFQRYQCVTCGKWTRSSENLMTPKKRKSLHKNTSN